MMSSPLLTLPLSCFSHVTFRLLSFSILNHSFSPSHNAVLSSIMSSSSFDIVGDDDSSFFRSFHSRTLNTLNTNYLLPVDQDEIKVLLAAHKYSLLTPPQRSDLHHRMLQFVFSSKNYIGPVKQVLQFGQQRRSKSTLSTPPNSLTASSPRPRHRRRRLVRFFSTLPPFSLSSLLGP